MTWPTKTDFVDGDVLTAAQVNNIGTNLNLANPTGITDGYVLTADGANSMGWEAVAAGGWTLINSGTLSGTSITSSTFSGYKQIHIDLANWSTSTDVPHLRVNGLSTSIYRYWRKTPTSSTATSNTVNSAETYIDLGYTYTSNGGSTCDIYNADNATGPKMVRAFSNNQQAGNTFQYMASYEGKIDTTAAITSVTILVAVGTFSGGNYYIWGLK